MDFDDRHHLRISRVRAGHVLLVVSEGLVAFPIHPKCIAYSLDARKCFEERFIFSEGRETGDKAVSKTKIASHPSLQYRGEKWTRLTRSLLH